MCVSSRGAAAAAGVTSDYYVKHAAAGVRCSHARGAAERRHTSSSLARIVPGEGVMTDGPRFAPARSRRLDVQLDRKTALQLEILST